MDSFLWPLIQELKSLANGVPAFDIISSTRFTLRAFIILVFGNILAMAMVMKMKGHNGYAPCHMCQITGLRIPNSTTTSLYVPLDHATHPDVAHDFHTVQCFNPHNLPLRTHDQFIQQAIEVDAATTQVAADRLSRKYGIKGRPLLSQLPSLRFPISFPFDFMHLVWENVVKNLILHWTGEFKGLDNGIESYQLSRAIWAAIGEHTARSGSTIPSAYGVQVPNIAADGVSVTAEMWSFWTLYIGPVLLQHKFKKPIYYHHFVRLVYLLNICLQFEIRECEIKELHKGFIKWVMEYEEYVSR